MWKGNLEPGVSSTEFLSETLFQEVQSGRLSRMLRCRLEQCERQDRAVICSRTREGCSPLFMACKRGHVEIVDYLLTVCNADVEQRGSFEVPEGSTVHHVTPLWCAAVAGELRVAEALVRHGADVNAASDTGSTPARSACFRSHVDIVKLLVLHSADIQRPNDDGGTCLINSVQSVELCALLLQNGANVNAQDSKSKTALHYAVQEHRFETTRLLLRHNANPFLESKYHDDALQTACLKGAADIFLFLIDNYAYDLERVASAYELMGSTFLHEHHDSQNTLRYWRAACDMRQRYSLHKTVLPPKEEFRFAREFANRADLESLATDLDGLIVQGLLVDERVLGTAHRDLIYRLFARGSAYRDSLQYRHCVDLWRYALQLRVAKDSILSRDACFAAQTLVKLYFHWHQESAAAASNSEMAVDPAVLAGVSIEDVISTIALLARDLPRSGALLTVHPRHREQQESYNQVLSIVTHLLHLLTQLPRDENKQAEICDRLRSILLRLNPRTTNGDSLLHLGVSRSNNTLDGDQYAFFPSLPVVRLLLECGVNPNAPNVVGDSPLHVAASGSNFKQQIVDALLLHGAHIDIRNGKKERPIDLLQAIPSCRINFLPFTSLQCLAAVVIVKNNLPYKNEVPVMLEEFIETH